MTLGHVTPHLPASDVADHCGTDPVVFSDRLPVPSVNADGPYLLSRQFGQPVSLPERFVRAPFDQHILRVVPLRAEEQMGGVAALRVIASMENEKTFRYASVHSLPSQSVRELDTVALSQGAIATPQSASPIPAALGFVAVKIKAIRQRPVAANALSRYLRGSHRLLLRIASVIRAGVRVGSAARLAYCATPARVAQ